jgi:hypothetical protein
LILVWALTSSKVVSACHYPPVATTSLLTYEICQDLDRDIASEFGYLCAIGTHGDLGNTLKWSPPFPDMTETFQRYTKKLINDCVSYINARQSRNTECRLVLREHSSSDGELRRDYGGMCFFNAHQRFEFLKFRGPSRM